MIPKFPNLLKYSFKELNNVFIAVFRVSILLLVMLSFQSAMLAKPADYYWSSIHIKQNDRWYLKQDKQYLKLDFDNISVEFKDQCSKQERDSSLTELHCIVQKIESRNNYLVKINSSTEYFYFLQQVPFMKNIENVSVRTLAGERIVDSLISEIRLRGRIFIKKEARWYMSQGGRLYEIVEDIISIRFKNGIKEGEQERFIEQNRFQILKKNRLNICDVEVPPPKPAILYFIQLYRHPLLDFIEINTRTGI